MLIISAVVSLYKVGSRINWVDWTIPRELHHSTQSVHLLPHPSHAPAEVNTCLLLPKICPYAVNLSDSSKKGVMFQHLIVSSKPRVHDDLQ